MATLDIFDLTGKRALVTGSSQGIGYALAEGLAKAGAAVVLNGRDAGKLAAAAAALRGAGATVAELPFDATDHAAVARRGRRLRGRDRPHRHPGEQRRHAAPRAPGGFPRGSLRADAPAPTFPRSSTSARRWRRHMIARGAGKIINIASVQSALARPGIAPYTATKGAVANLTKGMATDWARHGLQVNAIAPGYFDTPLNAALVADPAFTAWLEKRTPAGRWGQLPELVGACIFLASPGVELRERPRPLCRRRHHRQPLIRTPRSPPASTLRQRRSTPPPRRRTSRRAAPSRTSGTSAARAGSTGAPVRWARMISAASR